MNINDPMTPALNVLETLLGKGWDYADALGYLAAKFSITEDALSHAYIEA